MRGRGAGALRQRRVEPNAMRGIAPLHQPRGAPFDAAVMMAPPFR
ncbi:hypothetical protein BURMUCF2_A1664 [Burkholderia multivorans CF2]|nr:hypothetical protein BURMUCF2_A1664 [Burkholderia multivorans CF2]